MRRALLAVSSGVQLWQRAAIGNCLLLMNSVSPGVTQTVHGPGVCAGDVRVVGIGNGGGSEIAIAGALGETGNAPRARRNPQEHSLPGQGASLSGSADCAEFTSEQSHCPVRSHWGAQGWKRRQIQSRHRWAVRTKLVQVESIRRGWGFWVPQQGNIDQSGILPLGNSSIVRPRKKPRRP